MLATNAHVIEGGSPMLAVGALRIPLRALKIDQQHDLAILSVEADLTSKPLTLATRPTSPGDEVFAIGNPEGLENTISEGIVSGVRTADSGSLIQITSPISHGSSGGPILNDQGEVIGVAAMTLRGGQNLNFAVPVSYLQELLLASNVPNVASAPSPAPTPGYRFGVLQSWRNVKDSGSCLSGDNCDGRRYDIVSGAYVYSVTHALGMRSLSRFASIGARNPLVGLSPGSQVELRTEGKWMYIIDHKKKEAAYSIDEVVPK